MKGKRKIKKRKKKKKDTEICKARLSTYACTVFTFTITMPGTVERANSDFSKVV